MEVYKVLGMMSGTSLDGLDLAYCHLWKNQGIWEYDIKASKTIEYEQELRQKLKDAIHFNAEDLFSLDAQFGTFLGNQAREFIESESLTVDYIASHGHTIHHRPELGFTYQIGSGQHLANSSGKKVIADFRTNDVALGGEGAPFVPIGDEMFFGDYTFCLNLGGISNISFKEKGKRIAYDIGIANMVLNYICQKIDLNYDDKGQLARSGNLDQKLLQELNALEYHNLPYPKSTGYEWFTEEIVPLIEKIELSPADLLHTSVIHICEQTARQVQLHSGEEQNTMLITGGGAFNDFLIEALTEKLAGNTEIVVPPAQLISFKEALVFALMGILRIKGETNVLSSVTGASSDSSSGVVYLPS